VGQEFQHKLQLAVVAEDLINHQVMVVPAVVDLVAMVLVELVLQGKALMVAQVLQQTILIG
jgi:hypothetical protein